jgi:hypothetical protein
LGRHPVSPKATNFQKAEFYKVKALGRARKVCQSDVMCARMDAQSQADTELTVQPAGLATFSAWPLAKLDK